MFTILSKQDATLEEMARNFIEVAKFQSGLKTEYNTVNDRVIGLQLKAFTDQKVKESLEKEKVKFMDIQIKIESCTHYLKKLKERLAESMPVCFQKRMEEISKEYGQLSKTRKEKIREFLSMAAKCLVYFEQIDGKICHYNESIGDLVESNPQLVVTQSTFLDDDYKYFSKLVKNERLAVEKGLPIKKTMEKLSKEKDQIEKTIENFDPETEIQKFLEKAGFNPEECGMMPDDPKSAIGPGQGLLNL